MSSASEIRSKIKTVLEKRGDFVTGIEVRDGRGSGRFYSKASGCFTNFLFQIECKKVQYEVESNWNKNYKVADNGEVFDKNGNSMGWVKIITNHPKTCKRDYDEDTILIEVPKNGTVGYLLDEDESIKLIKALEDPLNDKINNGKHRI